MTERKHYSYVLDHDTGLAPNPFFGFLTLALCKPCVDGEQGPRNWIKKDWLEEGDVWVFANAGKDLLLEDYEYKNHKLLPLKGKSEHHNRLVMAFKVNEILTYEEYFNDLRFENKKTNDLHKNAIKKYGDNVIFKQNSCITQKIYKSEDRELENEIKCDKVLISKMNDFYYFGCFAPFILEECKELFLKAQGSKSINDSNVNKIVEKIKKVCPKPGIYGFPSFKSGNEYINDRRNEPYLKAIYEQFLEEDIRKELKRVYCEDNKFKNPTLKNVLGGVINCL